MIVNITTFEAKKGSPVRQLSFSETGVGASKRQVVSLVFADSAFAESKRKVMAGFLRINQMEGKPRLQLELCANDKAKVIALRGNMRHAILFFQQCQLAPLIDETTLELLNMEENDNDEFREFLDRSVNAVSSASESDGDVLSEEKTNGHDRPGQANGRSAESSYNHG